MASDLGPAVRILLIEPDELTAQEYVRDFKLRGWLVEHATTFTQSLNLLAQSSYDIALIEVLLPDTIGTDAWSHIRRLQPDILGIMTTSSRSLLASVNPTKEGVLAYLLKPLDLEAVSFKIRQAIKSQSESLSTRQLRQQLARLNGLLDNLNHSLDVKQTLPLALTQIHNLFNADTTVILILTPDGSAWAERYYRSTSSSDEQQPNEDWDYIEGLIWNALQSTQTHAIHAQMRVATPIGTPRVQDTQFGKLAVAPLLGALANYGALAVFIRRESHRSLTRLQLELVRTGAQLLIMALDKATIGQSQSQETIRHQATDFYSHGFLDQIVSLEVARQNRYQHPVSLVSLRFEDKSWGKDHNHESLELARIVRENLRASDVFAFENDQELAIVLTETGGQGAKQMVKRLGRIMEEHAKYGGWRIQTHSLPAPKDPHASHRSNKKLR